MIEAIRHRVYLDVYQNRNDLSENFHAVVEQVKKLQSGIQHLVSKFASSLRSSQ
jgi:hypothetical protein